MSAVLRAHNLPLEESLGLLANAVRERFPEHLGQLSPPQAHTIVVPAFVSGEARMYTIDIAVGSDRARYQRHVRMVDHDRVRPPRVYVAGSRASYFQRRNTWLRPLLRLVNAHDRGDMSAYSVADAFAALNNDVHLNMNDGSVGPRCIVSWRYNQDRGRKGGGDHRFYSGERPDDRSPALPTIARGLDIPAILSLATPQGMLADLLAGVPVREVNKEQVDAKLASLPQEPDEKLR
jgi:hypothetical protein